MTQVFAENGAVVPVTRVQAGPCQVVQVKDGASKVKAVQIGFGEAKEKRLKKPQSGHLKDLNPVSEMRDFTVASVEGVKRGDIIDAGTFVAGDKVKVVGFSKGKGFAGVVKRHHFRGGPASHGHKDNLRMPGAIGSGGIQRVFKGVRMAGRMGGDRITVKNLEIVEVHPEINEIYLKGAVPGGKNSLLMISGEGELKIRTEAAPVTEVEAETVPAKAEEQAAEVQSNP